MRTAVLIIFLCCMTFAQAATGQHLAGTWEGYFKYDRAVSIPPVHILLKFVWNANNAYTVHSFTVFPADKLPDTTTCEASYTLLGTDSLYVEEIRDTRNKEGCLQKMYLRISMEKKPVLRGIWFTEGEACADSGPIWFYKKE